MSGEQWFWGVVTVVVLAAIGWVAIEAVNAPTIEEPTPLDELMDGPEQVAEDRPAAEMWDSFEVDDTAAEADVVPAHSPAVVAQGRALVADLDAWLAQLDTEAWLGERGWL